MWVPWRVGLLSLVLYRLCVSVENPYLEAGLWKLNLARLDNCFCQLAGQLEDCCCDVETVDSLNREKIYPRISELVAKSYFKFYQVDLVRPCPFWPEDSRCVLQDCHVEECTEDEIPSFLKAERLKEDAPAIKKLCTSVSEEEVELSAVDDTISLEQLAEFMVWKEYDQTEDNFCDIQENSQNLSYVDLLLNPERYTGYSGQSTQRIWRAIYQENCFRPEGDHSFVATPVLFQSSLLQELCLEKRAFYRLISGLHSSINIHLSAMYIKTGELSSSPRFGPNLGEFVQRFDSAEMQGQGTLWLKNLYFAYLVVLRAVSRAERYLESQAFYTGDTALDRDVKRRVMEIVQAAKDCSFLFDESQMFTGEASKELKNEFNTHFKNISRIMDCVGCDKCKLWGKLQVHGIGTALKVLFAQSRNGVVKLSRREIVALFNVLGRFSSSLHHLDNFRQMLQDQRGAATLDEETY